MEKCFKYRIYPNKSQQELIQKTFGCVRYVYNYYLDKKIKLYREENKLLSCNDCSKDLTNLKSKLTWLKEPDKCALQNSLKDLTGAYVKFFKEQTGYPKFKTKKDNHKSYRTNGVIKFFGKHIQLPKLGYVKIRDKQIPQGRIINATIIQEANGHYYVSLCCTDIIPKTFDKTNNNIGIDLGIKNFAIFSNGVKIDNPKFYEKSEDKLVTLQRKLSRKTIGGSNWNKARIKFAKLHKHITEQKRDFLQKLTTDIVRKYDIICIEDLHVDSMKESKSNVNNKHINDVSWSKFRRMLEYKCKWYGRELKVVDRFFPSSQICNVCGHNDGKKELQIRSWTCHCCGSVLDRDINAAINILNEGLKYADNSLL